MKPVVALEEGKNSRGEPVSLDQRDGILHLRHGGMTALATDSHDADMILAETASQPMRPARQPRILVASRGFDAGVRGVQNVLTQSKAQIYVCPPERKLRDWWSTHITPLAPEPDDRVITLKSSLSDFLEEVPEGLHAIVVNLDVLRATNPGDISLFTTGKGMARVAAALRNGGVLGIAEQDLDPALLKLASQHGLTAVTDSFPTSEKARKPRYQKVLLARKGHYKPQVRQR